LADCIFTQGTVDLIQGLQLSGPDGSHAQECEFFLVRTIYSYSTAPWRRMPVVLVYGDSLALLILAAMGIPTTVLASLKLDG
jgi:hypothetical protein